MRGSTSGLSAKVNSSSKGGIAVIPNDSTVLYFDALYIGGAGDVVVTNLSGEVLDYPAVNGGAFFPVAGDRVMAATSASDIVAVIW